MKKIMVIGGSNIDLLGKTYESVIMEDSNPGDIEIAFGGVGRNITENLIRLGLDVTFVTAIGNDNFGKSLEKDLLDLGVKIIKPDTNSSNSIYIVIHDNVGTMKLGLCDNKILKSLDIDFFKAHDKDFEDKEIIVIDTNLEQDVIDYLANTYQDKILISDAISAIKVKKLSNILDKLYLLKANEYEYISLKQLASKKNPQNLVVSQGPEAVLYYHNFDNCLDKILDIPVIKKEKIVNATGAGDAMISGIIYGIAANKDIVETIQLGIKAASVALDCIPAVNPNIKSIIE